MPYDPNAAPAPKPMAFKNTVECIANRLITVAEGIAEKIIFEAPDRAGEDKDAPFWDLRYKALDTIWSDGGDYMIKAGTRLFVKDRETGKFRAHDNTQRPSVISRAFAGHQISAFPGDPNGRFDAWCAANGLDTIGVNPSYNEAAMIGNKFIVEQAPRDKSPNAKYDAKRDTALPTSVLGATYLFPGLPDGDGIQGGKRVLTPRDNTGMNSDGQMAPSAASFVNILEDAEAREKVLSLIAGKSVTALDDALFNHIPHSYQINGAAVLGAAVEGTLAPALAEKGLITIQGDLVVLAVGTPA